MLFEEVDPLKNIYDDQTHLAYITSLIGTPPKKLLERGRRTSLFYNTDCKSLFSHGGITDIVDTQQIALKGTLQSQ